MTSEEEERPRFFTGGYGRHSHQWVKKVLPTCENQLPNPTEKDNETAVHVIVWLMSFLQVDTFFTKYNSYNSCKPFFTPHQYTLLTINW